MKFEMNTELLNYRREKAKQSLKGAKILPLPVGIKL